MLARDYPRALKALKEHVATNPKNLDETLLLTARAAALLGEREKALEALDLLFAKIPDSPLRNKALFAKADILVALNRTEDALKIYEEQARRVTAEERRLQLAGVYLKFADEFFKPKDEVKKPDFGKASLFYAKAMEMGLPADREADVVGKRAQALSKIKRAREARDLLASWRKAHPGHAKDTELALAQGEANLVLGDRVGARRLFRDLLASAPPVEITVKALFGIARSFQLPTPRTATDLELGAKALRDIATRFPDHADAPKALFEVCASYIHLKRYDEACRELEGFLASPMAKAGVKEVPEAKHLLGLCHFFRKEYGAAIRVWRGFLGDHPAHGLWTQVQRHVIDAEFATGLDLYTAKSYGPAKKAWDAFLEAHPLDPRCPRILLLYGKGDHEQKRFEEAVAQWEKLVSKYPRTAEASEGLFRIGMTLETDLGRFVKALEAYRKLNFGPFAHKARERIAALEKKTLRLRTERIFRTNEKALVKVSVRNIETLEFRAWSVDLEAYFRKMHTAAGVQALDVPLIEPDKTWKVEIKPYEPYREIEREIPLPFTGAGVWAVNGSGADLEATTVVVSSDLALIIKGSRKNVLVLSQNMRTEKPVGGVKILVSDGEKILMESETGADGVLYADAKEIASAASLRVLGALGGSWASNTLDLRRLPPAVGLSRKAFVFTDRPAYRPGDRVHVKAILREVEKGAYAFTKDEPYTIHAVRAGQLVRQGEAKLTAFGTLDWAFTLPANAPLGRYTLSILRKKEPRFTHRFHVVEYKTPKLNVVVKLDHAVCYRGEKVKGKVVVTTFYGEAAPGREVKIRFGHLPKKTGITDARGEVPFAFETREFGETQTVTLWATIPAEGVQGGARAHIATTGFSLKMKTLRSVYLTGEPFDLEVKATDLAGKPVAVPVEVGVYRLEETEGRILEVPVHALTLTTDAAEGRVKKSVVCPKGGRHRIRGRSKDRFGNTVTSEIEVFLSGKEDEVKIRILSDREEYRLGEAPLIDIHHRFKMKTVLLTFEGERVFRYRVVRLPSGKNAVKVGMDELLAPNFILSASVLDGADLHEASREFRVTRGLQVSVRALDATHTPGGKARIEVFTRDPLGRPVSAEVALAMVDSAYLALYPRADRDPSKVFFTRRMPGCGTVATNTFAFEAVTRKMLESLKEEERRHAQKKQRAEELRKLVHRLKSETESAGKDGKAGVEYASRANRILQDRKKSKEKHAGWGDEPAPEDALYESSKGREEGLPNRNTFPKGFFREDIRLGGGGGGQRAQLIGASILALMEEAGVGIVETGYWNPKVVTDAKGRAIVEVPLPANVTTWKLFAAGTTASLIVGTAEGALTARKDLVVELKAPMSLVEGDVAKVRARVRNLTEKTLKAEVTLAWIDGEKRESLGGQTVSIPASGERELVFEVKGKTQGDRLLAALAASGERMDTAQERVRIFAKGTEIRRGWGGTATGTRTVRIAVPERDFAWRALAITVGASLSRSLLEIGRPAPWVRWCREPAVFFSPADRGFLALAKRDFLKATGRANQGNWARYDRIIEAAVADLAVSQRRDGGFGWTPRGASNVYATSQAVRFLARAKAEGFPFDARILTRGRTNLQKAFSTTEDNTVKAAVLWAFAHLGAAEFAYVNRLYRNRESLTPWAQAALTLTLVKMDRGEMASRLAQLIEKKLDAERATPSPEEMDKRGVWVNRWVDSDRAEILALSVLALSKALPTSGKLGKYIDRLMSLKTGSVWPTGKATAGAAEALALYLTQVKVAEDRYHLTLAVNGKDLTTLAMDGAAGRRTVEVDAEAFKGGENHIAFRMEGVGRYTYRIDFLGLTRGEDESQKDRFVRIKREVHPPPMVLKGPGGVILQRDSIRGHFDHFEVRPGKILFFLREGVRAGTIRFRYFGTLPGTYRMKATRVWSAVEPSRLSTGSAGALTILPAGETSPDPHRPTPDERLALGRERYEAKDFKNAEKSLAALFSKFHLRPAPFGEVARMLLFCAVELEQASQIVKYFEILKERFGAVEIPLDKTLVIAKAYRSLGENELALQVYQGLLEACFLKESNIAADLEDQGNFLDALGFMENLLREYPDLPILMASHFALTQSVYNHAEGKGEGTGRAQMIGRAAKMLRAFLGNYPAHRLSDQAGFSLANAYLALKAGNLAGDLAEVLVKVHGESPFLDEFHYIAALAYFRAHKWDRALGHAEKVADGRFLMPGGAKGESPKKHLAVYIMGQIHHAQGDFAKAAEHYAKVADRFGDAKAALEQFKWKRLFLPEVTRFKAGEAVTVTVSHRNLTAMNLLVYPVDLMKLYLIRKNLDEIATVNLAGIRPFHAKDVELGTEREYKDRETKVALPVEKEGAYLVVAKGDGIEASGLVVLSNLNLEVQEDTRAGRIRVTVRSQKTNLFEGDAHVKVVSSESGEIVSGDTDLRGVFEAGALIGNATVIVKKETSYAFFRGDAVHRPVEAMRRRAQRGAALFGPPAANKGQPVQTLSLAEEAFSQELLERSLAKSNSAIQQKNVRALQTMTRTKQRGMKAEQARRK
jgi:tetratricopeptide (TPR) repeat protein